MEDGGVPLVVRNKFDGVEAMYAFDRIEYKDYTLCWKSVEKIARLAREYDERRVVSWLVENKDLIEAVWWGANWSRKCRMLARAYRDPSYANRLRRTAKWRRRISESLIARHEGKVKLEEEIAFNRVGAIKTPFGRVYAIYDFFGNGYALLIPEVVFGHGDMLIASEVTWRLADRIALLMKGDRRGLKGFEPLTSEHESILEQFVEAYPEILRLSILVLPME